MSEEPNLELHSWESRILFIVLCTKNYIQLSAITLEQSLTLPDSLKFLHNKMSLFVIENDHIGSLGNQVSCSRRKIVGTMSKKERVEVGWGALKSCQVPFLRKNFWFWCSPIDHGMMVYPTLASACKWNVSKLCCVCGLLSIASWETFYDNYTCGRNISSLSLSSRKIS